MNGEQRFWISIWAVIGATLLGFTLAVTAYWMDHNKKIVELIGTGVDPVAVMCAMQDDYGRHPTCILLATKKD